eukprot:12408922-Karenia_brevis.AAC.1
MRCDKALKCSVSTQPSQHARRAYSDSMWPSCSMRCDRGLECSASTQPSQYARKANSGSMWRSC